ncbi:MAG: hypothetical protein IPO92_19335 [Saprospiraceae bacterium]|nr:hypothetical protein [Saprospiraceae bacterium]
MTSFKGLFAFLDMLLKNEKMYHYPNKLDWNIQSVEMMETLLANDIKLIEIIEILVYHKKITYFKKTLTNHDISSKIICNNKLSNIIKHALKNNDLAILDLLFSKGMCRSREDLVTRTGIAFAEKRLTKPKKYANIRLRYTD